MAVSSLEVLQAADLRLTRSFAGCVAILAVRVGWTIFAAPDAPDLSARALALPLLFLVLQVGFYIWYAISAGAAAKALGSEGWYYVVWILAAPFLALIPIPLVSGLISISPLSIKFLLGGQLNTAIRDESFGQLHRSG